MHVSVLSRNINASENNTKYIFCAEFFERISTKVVAHGNNYKHEKIEWFFMVYN